MQLAFPPHPTTNSGRVFCGGMWWCAVGYCEMKLNVVGCGGVWAWNAATMTICHYGNANLINKITNSM